MDVYERKTVGERLSGNPYPGRGIAVGMSGDGLHAAAAYFIMGRSGNSRNRIFTMRDGAVYTEPYDPSKVEDPSLIIYAAVRPLGRHLIVTNGDQTDTIYESVKNGGTFAGALRERAFEPDAPNFTPRISAMLTMAEGAFTYQMSILKSIDAGGGGCARYTFEYPSTPGLGHLIHTYVSDGSPLPSFQGEPERASIPDSIDEFTSDIWDSLDADNRISLYTRYTSLEDGAVEECIINKNGGAKWTSLR